MNPVWAEDKREERDGRCLIPGKNRKLIRCPESRKCSECKLYSEACKECNKTASLSLLAEEGTEPACQESFEDDVVYGMILQDLISMIGDIKPEYGSIFQMLYDGITQKEMAAELEMNERTISDYVKAVRQIIRPKARDIFDR